VASSRETPGRTSEGEGRGGEGRIKPPRFRGSSQARGKNSTGGRPFARAQSLGKEKQSSENRGGKLTCLRALRAPPRTLLSSACLVSLSSQPFFLPPPAPLSFSRSFRPQEETFGADHYPGPGVPSAISSALKPLQLQTPTVPSPLFRPPSPPGHPFGSPRRLGVPSPLFLSFSLPRLALARPRYVAARRSPFTFAHCSRKSNFVTRAASSSPSQGSVLHSGEITRRSAPQARKKISLIELPSAVQRGCPLASPAIKRARRQARTRATETSISGIGYRGRIINPRKQRPPGVLGMRVKNACG